MPKTPTIDPDIGRKAKSAMLHCICMRSPSQFAFRNASREFDQLRKRQMAGEDVGDELTACAERLMAAASAVETQWAALFDARFGPIR